MDKYLLLSIIIIGIVVGAIVVWNIYKVIYYRSQKFNLLKDKVETYVNECNDMNSYIEELKMNSSDFRSKYKGSVSTYDKNTGNYNYKRSNIGISHTSAYKCSLQVFKSAREQPYKYLCKYFEIEKDEKTLELLGDELNRIISVEQGIELLLNKRKSIISKIENDVPRIILRKDNANFIRKLGFMDINIKKDFYTEYIFSYTSAGGNSGQSFSIIFDSTKLNDFINWISGEVKVKKSAKYQRSLMTKTLRENIKQRDNYTCQCCGISIYQEPHLLLEIDHIIPVSKGGITTEDNLQTLCWKCNRSKSDKL